MNKYLILIGICFWGLFNTTLAQKTIKYEFKDFMATVSLKQEKQKTDMLMNPGLMELHDSLLFFRNYGCSPNYSVLNVKTGKIVNSFGIKGRGPGEMITPFGFEILEDQNLVVVNDLIGKKIVRFSLSKILNKDPNPFMDAIKINTPFSRVLWGKKELICALKLDKDYYTHGILDPLSGKVIRKFGRYPKLKVKYSPLDASNLFQRPLGTYLQEYNTYSEVYFDYNRIDIYKDEQLSIILSGKENEKLIYQVNESGPILTDENNFCFVQITSDDNKIYASYSGNTQRGKDIRCVINKVLVFDIEGNSLELYNIDPPVNYLAFDFENRTIWGINKVLEPTLYKYQY